MRDGDNIILLDYALQLHQKNAHENAHRVNYIPRVDDEKENRRAYPVASNLTLLPSRSLR